MANRYNSILENAVSNIVSELRTLHPHLPQADWIAKDGKLVARMGGQEYEFSFERGDPITDALLLFLNNNHYLLTVLEQK